MGGEVGSTASLVRAAPSGSPPASSAPRPCTDPAAGLGNSRTHAEELLASRAANISGCWSSRTTRSTRKSRWAAEGIGLDADLANDGAEALQKVGESRHDLILMDMQMPVMDGLEATRAIRRARLAAMPILAMTGQRLRGQAALPRRRHERSRGEAGRSDALFSALLRWLPASLAAAGQRGPLSTAKSLHRRPPTTTPACRISARAGRFDIGAGLRSVRAAGSPLSVPMARLSPKHRQRCRPVQGPFPCRPTTRGRLRLAHTLEGRRWHTGREHAAGGGGRTSKP